MFSSNDLISFIRSYYNDHSFIPLHRPTFDHHEKENVLDTIESSFVSSVGGYVNEFEKLLESYTGATKAVAMVNGTAALHCALYSAGVEPGDIVITQAVTFVATCNVIHYLHATPLFIDVNKYSLGLCPDALSQYLEENALIDIDGQCRHRKTSQIIRAIVPMHTFGHPVQLFELNNVCQKWNIVLVEDAAESLGSLYKGKHTGTFGKLAALSFNGNKIITTGGGGATLCMDENLGKHVKHLSTTAKVPHPFEYYHDEMGFNYRMPNLNAALGCAQVGKLNQFVLSKRELARKYQCFFDGSKFSFVTEPEYARSNYWLNAIICPSKVEKEHLLKETNANGVMTRPLWQLANTLPMFEGALRGALPNSEWLIDRVVNLPSTPLEKSCI